MHVHVYNVRANYAIVAVINCRLLNDINNWDPGRVHLANGTAN